MAVPRDDAVTPRLVDPAFGVVTMCPVLFARPSRRRHPCAHTMHASLCVTPVFYAAHYSVLHVSVSLPFSEMLPPQPSLPWLGGAHADITEGGTRRRVRFCPPSTEDTAHIPAAGYCVFTIINHDPLVFELRRRAVAAESTSVGTDNEKKKRKKKGALKRIPRTHSQTHHHIKHSGW